MMIAIRQWKKEDVRDVLDFYIATTYSTKFKVNEVPFYAEFTLKVVVENLVPLYDKIRYHLQDIRIYHNDRLVTVIPNKYTDTDVADKLIVDAFQNNPALRYLVNRKNF